MTTNSAIAQIESIVNSMEATLAEPNEDRFAEGFDAAIDCYLSEMKTLLNTLKHQEKKNADKTVSAETLSARSIDQDILIRAEVRQVYHNGAETILSVVHEYEDPNRSELTEISMNHDTPVTFAGKERK